MLYLILALSSGIIGGLIVAVIPQVKDRIQKYIVLIFTVFGAYFTWRVAALVFSGESVRLSIELGSFSFCIDPDPLGVIFGLIASTLWVFTAVYSFGYMAGKHKQRTYYTFFLISLSMTVGVAFSGNLFALYLFYELLTFSTYPLIIQERGIEAMKAGAKYIIYNLSGAGAILIAIIETYNRAGKLGFAGGPILAGSTGSGLNWLLALFIIGFGVKAAIMPLHRWLPAAMVAPTPVSALLHAVAVVYSGVFGVLRVIYSVFGHELAGQLKISRFLPWIAAFTILAGVVTATQQDVLKRRLAYHTISQLSYILLGAFTLQPWGLTGAILHMISYSMLKITLFFCAGIIAEKTGETKVSKIGGVGWLLPGTMAAFAAASLGMIGMLPLNTFWSKYFLMKGIVAGGKWPFALVLIVSGIINAVCFIPTVVTSFSGEKVWSNGERGNRVALMLAPTVFLAAIALFIGLYPGIIWPGVQAVVNCFY